MEAGGSEAQGHSQIQMEFKGSLSYISPSQNTEQTKIAAAFTLLQHPINYFQPGKL